VPSVLYATFMRSSAVPTRIHMRLRPHLGQRSPAGGICSLLGGSDFEAREKQGEPSMAAVTLRGTSLIEMVVAKMLFQSTEPRTVAERRGVISRSAPSPVRSYSPSCTLDLSKSRTYAATSCSSPMQTFPRSGSTKSSGPLKRGSRSTLRCRGGSIAQPDVSTCGCEPDRMSKG
jgi:hypothetical protein